MENKNKLKNLQDTLGLSDDQYENFIYNLELSFPNKKERDEYIALICAGVGKKRQIVNTICPPQL